MPTLTITLDPRLGVEPMTSECADVAALLDAVDDHDRYWLAESEDSTSIIMTSDDGRTVWYVLTIPDADPDDFRVQLDTFTLPAPPAFHIVNRDHAATGGAGRVRCECGSRTFTTDDPTDVERFVGTFTCTICSRPWETRNIVQRLAAVPADAR